MGAEFWDRESLGKPPEFICVVDKLNIFIQCCWSGSPWHVPEAGPILPQNSIIWGGHLDFCFIRFTTHWDHFCLGSCLFLQNRLFYTLSLLVLILYSPKKALSFSFKVTMSLHYLWVGPLQAIAVTTLLWMEIGISCLAGMAVLIIFLLLQSCVGNSFSSLR